MLYIVGLGLSGWRDLSVRGLEAVKASDMVYAEFYTSKFSGKLDEFEAAAGKKITALDRSALEEHPEDNVLKKDCGSVCLLVPGDPLVATTHADLMLRARKVGVETKVIHSSSVYSAIGETGLQLYKFGKTTTIAYPEGDYFPTSPYDAIEENRSRGLHTLCLLDVKADIGKYMSVKEGLELLQRMEDGGTEKEERDYGRQFNSRSSPLGRRRRHKGRPPEGHHKTRLRQPAARDSYAR